MQFNRVYFEPDILDYELGRFLKEKYKDLDWHSISNHNNIEELRSNPNSEFRKMKRYLIIGTRKTHNYRENEKSSDYLVPFTSSGCSAMCMYCYLVCSYNKCSYLRVFVNREQMMGKLIRTSMNSQWELTFEIGSNSDLILENQITGNLPWVIEEFAGIEKGYLTFPTKFSMVDPILGLNHRERTLVRMSVNPQEIISSIEIGTASLKKRLESIRRLYEHGYPVGILIAPVIFIEGWEAMYRELIQMLADELPPPLRETVKLEIIFMTYSFVHRAINQEAFPDSPELYDPAMMTGRGRGKYTYRNEMRAVGEHFFHTELGRYFAAGQILYIV